MIQFFTDVIQSVSIFVMACWVGSIRIRMDDPTRNAELQTMATRLDTSPSPPANTPMESSSQDGDPTIQETPPPDTTPTRSEFLSGASVASYPTGPLPYRLQ